MQDGLYLCTYIVVFSVASDGATTERQIQNRFRGHFFVPVLGRIASPIMHKKYIWTLFSTSVTGPDALCNANHISQIRLQLAL